MRLPHLGGGSEVERANAHISLHDPLPPAIVVVRLGRGGVGANRGGNGTVEEVLVGWYCREGETHIGVEGRGPTHWCGAGERQSKGAGGRTWALSILE